MPRAGIGRPQSRRGDGCEGGRCHQGIGLRGRVSAINLPLSGASRERCPLPSALYPPAPHVRRRQVARLSWHTGGLGAPQAVGLLSCARLSGRTVAPPRVGVRSGGRRVGMRTGDLERCLVAATPAPPIGGWLCPSCVAHFFFRGLFIFYRTLVFWVNLPSGRLRGGGGASPPQRGG